MLYVDVVGLQNDAAWDYDYEQVCVAQSRLAWIQLDQWGISQEGVTM